MPAHDSSAFISYSREDSEFALRLARDLKEAGASVWLDQLDIRPGVLWDNAIEDALIAAPQMLLVLSPSSSKSDNVRNEISFALEAGKVIIPVLYADCVVPLRLQRNQRIDFRADYAHGLTALLGYLKVTNPDPQVLQRAADGDVQRHAAWHAREAEAERLQQRQQLEEAARLKEDTERKKREESDRATREAEQVRLREAAARKALEESNRRTEAARIAEEKRKSEEAATANQLQNKPANKAPEVPLRTEKLPPGNVAHPAPDQSGLPPSTTVDTAARRSWQPGRATVVALSVALVLAFIAIFAISRNSSSSATIVQGNTGSTPSGTPAQGSSTGPSPATTKTTRPSAPNQNAKPQFDIAQALNNQGKFAEAAKAGELALSLDPQSEDILQFLSFIDHEKLYKFERAYELDQMRVDLGYGQSDFVEATLTSGRFDSCATQAATGWRITTEARLKIVMSALEFACLTGENNTTDARTVGTQLRQEISGLKGVGWTFNGTEHFVSTNSAFAPNGAAWSNLFDALSSGDEKSATAALTTLGISN